MSWCYVFPSVCLHGPFSFFKGHHKMNSVHKITCTWRFSCQGIVLKPFLIKTLIRFKKKMCKRYSFSDRFLQTQLSNMIRHQPPFKEGLCRKCRVAEQSGLFSAARSVASLTEWELSETNYRETIFITLPLWGERGRACWLPRLLQRASLWYT